MRELIGKIPTKDPNITYVVYLSELVRCLECEQQWHIEVVAVKKSGDSKKVLWHVCHCRIHGLDYETKAKSLPMRPHAQSKTLHRFNNPDWGTETYF